MTYPKPKPRRKRYKKNGIPDYYTKYARLFQEQGGCCAISGLPVNACGGGQLHHVIANSKTTRKLYPRYIHSAWNLRLVCGGPHDSAPLPKKPPYWKVERAEQLLKANEDMPYDMDLDTALERHCLEVMR